MMAGSPLHPYSYLILDDCNDPATCRVAFFKGDFVSICISNSQHIQ